MNTQTKNTFYAAASLAVATGTLIPSSALAGYVNQSAVNCRAVTEWTAYDLNPDGKHVVPATPSLNGSAPNCPILDDDAHPHDSIDQVQVFVEDRNSSTAPGGIGSVFAQACIEFSSTSGGACGNGAGTGASFTGFAQLTITDVSALTSHPNDYAFVRVFVPPPQGSAMSSVAGYSMLY